MEKIIKAIKDHNNNLTVRTHRIGFLGKKGTLFLQTCPKCWKENYALSVSSGTCAWCGFDGNKKLEIEGEKNV